MGKAVLMNRKGLPALMAFASLLFLSALPAAHATVQGPYDLYVTWAVSGYSTDNADQMYPSGTVYFDYRFYNTGSSSVTITQIELDTPWQTYTDASLPLTISPGQEYYSYFTIAIPSSQQLGTITWTFKNSEVGFSPSSNPSSIKIFANPDVLQGQINTLNSQVASLQSQVSSLQSQLTAAKTNATNLQNTVTSLKTELANKTATITLYQAAIIYARTLIQNQTAQIKTLTDQVSTITSQANTLKSQLATAQSQLSNATAQVSTLTSQLQTAQSDISSKAAQISTLTSQLSDTKASLAKASLDLVSTKNELTSYSSLYLPAGVAIPSIVAVLLLVLYLRKGSRPGPAAAAMPPQQLAPAVAPPSQTAATSKFCSNCGTANKLSAKFCAKCGTSIS